MKILALETDVPGVPDDSFTEKVLKEEALQAWALYQQGVVRELYFRSDRHTAVLVLECVDVETARAHLATLPLVRDGLIAFELVGLTPYPGFARLWT
jgi:hypothetical protein